ncbi:MAG: protein-L-isoaspartate(D-aspartate) O-methyltransferase [Myxococcales bacterium]|nr:protein-L-isoaspartate(D-aspartate) O-methyltransferase [Myxococcales bacterium]MBK7196394.1 protein-L-isoaspartate(D-aspartate) O-methyltransferase [Myxococcales bacterium]MBP6847805.1 protein-L-isoaspartate(D-aspartate) O-methyltransferase [Kofleriaceae bacterium]
MVDDDVAARGVSDPRVLTAMRAVPRERFVPPALAELAYADRPLPIGEGQTISQPYVVAWMAEALELAPTDRVLEIGTGSGYAAAVLAQLTPHVWSVERVPALAARARANLAAAGVAAVQVVEGDGTLGLPALAPFDAIVLTAAGPAVPAALCAQLADGGRLVAPVGAQDGPQELVRLRRAGARLELEALGAVQFVPLIGAQGFAPR